MAIINKDTKEGEEFAGKPKKVSLARIWMFSGGLCRVQGFGHWITRHLDPEAARKEGFPSVVASSTHPEGHVLQLMVDLFGVDWLSHGRADLSRNFFINAGDTLVTTALVKSKEAQQEATRFTMEVYCENQSSQKVLEGVTTGIIGKVDPSTAAAEYRRRLAELVADGTINHDVADFPQLEPLEFMVTPELNQEWLYGLEDFHPRYIEESESGPPMVHPGMIVIWGNPTRSPSFISVEKSATVGLGGFTRDEIFFCNPARLGKKLTVKWIPVGSFLKQDDQGKTFVYRILDAPVVDEDGLVIVRRFIHNRREMGGKERIQERGTGPAF